MQVAIRKKTRVIKLSMTERRQIEAVTDLLNELATWCGLARHARDVLASVSIETADDGTYTPTQCDINFDMHKAISENESSPAGS